MSAKPKPINPYARLLSEFRQFLSNVRYPERKRLWVYPKAKLREGFRLDGLAERIAAADLLGYDTILTSTDEGLVVTFRKRPNESLLPWSLK
jgi:hypothetical protein